MQSSDVSVLLVDDDEVDRRSLIRALRKHGMTNEFVEAGDGLAALELIRNHGPQELRWPYIILLDINMPRMDGLQFLAEVRSDEELQHLVVLVLTSSDDERDLTAAYQHSIAGYILKATPRTGLYQVAALVDAMSETITFPQRVGTDAVPRPNMPGTTGAKR
jgi:CheY-like chemotaxis protein